MLHLTELWRQELDKNRTGGVLFIDFKKAFDSICLEAMALKFKACGLSGNLYNFIVDLGGCGMWRLQYTCTVLNLLFHWSPLSCASTVFRDRDIVM